ncbi:MAG: GTP cyclohydrolase I FolE [Planctomycetota bacterium]
MKPKSKGPDLPRIEKAVTEILEAIGENPSRDGLQKTPGRVARMYAELFAGLWKDPREDLKALFEEAYEDMILVRDISFDSMCEHHLLPFSGRAHVAYIPKGRVLGLSKFARLVDSFAKRPQVQERLTNQIADTLMKELKPYGVAVVLEASHSCMTIRGVKKHGSLMTTSAMHGQFRKDAKARTEVLNLIHNGRPT